MQFCKCCILNRPCICVSFVQPQQQNSNLSLNALGSLAPQPATCSSPTPPASTAVDPNLQSVSQPSTSVSAGNQATTTHIPHPPSGLCPFPNPSCTHPPLPQPEPPMQSQQQPPSKHAQHPSTLVRLAMYKVQCIH